MRCRPLLTDATEAALQRSKARCFWCNNTSMHLELHALPSCAIAAGVKLKELQLFWNLISISQYLIDLDEVFLKLLFRIAMCLRADDVHNSVFFGGNTRWSS